MALTVTTSMQLCKTNELRSWDTATAPLTHCTARQETSVTSPDGLKGHHGSMGYVVFMKHERSYNYKLQVVTQAMNQVYVTFKVM
jgi:hypothetical protein